MIQGNSFFESSNTPNQSDATEIDAKDSNEKRFQNVGVLLLGRDSYQEYSSRSNTAMEIFLNSASIKLTDSNAIHSVNRGDNFKFIFMIHIRAHRMYAQRLFTLTNLVFILPNDEDDFKNCHEIIEQNQHLFAADTKIYYMNKFAKNTHDHFLIEKFAKSNKYRSVEVSQVTSLLDNVQKQYTDKLLYGKSERPLDREDTPDIDAAQSNDDTTNSCCLL